ncbi:hypothetical protein C8R44DRAFT_870854 [Mycena epipterygia]|nr:hypothetical protein C8R44DRAFT_870854 [Mycena epipterygia]
MFSRLPQERPFTHHLIFWCAGSRSGLGVGEAEKALAKMEGESGSWRDLLAAAEETLAKFTSIDSSSTVVPVQLDITDAASIKNAHAFIANYLQGRNLAGLDVLINNAGIVGTSFETTFAVNVFGTVAIKEAIRPLLNNGGAILNISSILGSKWRYSQQPPPDRALEENQKGSGIRVVSICPGFNATNLNGYRGVNDPTDGCKVIVKTALEKEGRSGVFINKNGDLPW